MPGNDGNHVFRSLTWEEAFTEDPLIVLTLAQMQGTIELASLIPDKNVLSARQLARMFDAMDRESDKSRAFSIALRLFAPLS